MSLFDLTGEVAIITGSTRGIGRAIADAMADHGAKVVISSRKPDACEVVATDINARYGAGTAIAVPANISSKDSLQNLVDQTRREFGKISSLVCNAASNPYYGPMAEIPDDAFSKILTNNIVANNWLVSMVIADMIEARHGSITIISSIGGMKGSTTIGAYGISKAADMQLARNLAAEYGPYGVRANCIAPGLVKTDFSKALWEDAEALEQLAATAPLRRIGEPREIAGAAVFLAAPSGAFTTGQTFIIDGGVTAV